MNTISILHNAFFTNIHKNLPKLFLYNKCIHYINKYPYAFNIIVNIYISYFLFWHLIKELSNINGREAIPFVIHSNHLSSIKYI